jgi:hypothetical protein
MVVAAGADTVVAADTVSGPDAAEADMAGAAPLTASRVAPRPAGAMVVVGCRTLGMVILPAAAGRASLRTYPGLGSIDSLSSTFPTGIQAGWITDEQDHLGTWGKAGVRRRRSSRPPRSEEPGSWWSIKMNGSVTRIGGRIAA